MFQFLKYISKNNSFSRNLLKNNNNKKDYFYYFSDRENSHQEHIFEKKDFSKTTLPHGKKDAFSVLEALRMPKKTSGNVFKKALVFLLSTTQILTPSLSNALYASSCMVDVLQEEDSYFRERSASPYFPASYTLDQIYQDTQEKGYGVALSSDLFEHHRDITFYSRANEKIATMTLVGRKITLKMQRDVDFILAGLSSFKDFDVEIDATKRIGLWGDTTVKSLTVKAEDLCSGSLQTHSLNATLSGNFIGSGVVLLDDAEGQSSISAGGEIVFQKNVASLGAVELKAARISTLSNLTMANKPLSIEVSERFTHHGTLTTQGEAAFKGDGVIENKGIMNFGDTVSLEGDKDKKLTLLNRQGATFQTAGSLLGSEMNVTNEGLISSGLEIDLVGDTLVNTGQLKSRSALTITTQNIQNSGTIESTLGLKFISNTVNNTGNLFSSGTLSAFTKDLFKQHGTLGSLHSVIFEGKALDVRGLTLAPSIFYKGRHLSTTETGFLHAQDLLSLNTQTLDNKGSITSQGTLLTSLTKHEGNALKTKNLFIKKDQVVSGFKGIHAENLQNAGTIQETVSLDGFKSIHNLKSGRIAVQQLSTELPFVNEGIVTSGAKMLTLDTSRFKNMGTLSANDIWVYGKIFENWGIIEGKIRNASSFAYPSASFPNYYFWEFDVWNSIQW